jgi:hypothetical protein
VNALTSVWALNLLTKHSTISTISLRDLSADTGLSLMPKDASDANSDCSKSGDSEDSDSSGTSSSSSESSNSERKQDYQSLVKKYQKVECLIQELKEKGNAAESNEYK